MGSTRAESRSCLQILVHPLLAEQVDDPADRLLVVLVGHERGVGRAADDAVLDSESYEQMPGVAAGDRARGVDAQMLCVDRVPLEERYDYNHRGQSQVLMHGLISRRQAERGGCAYEILHGNELLGARPGVLGDKATDHAYVIAGFDTRA